MSFMIIIIIGSDGMIRLPSLLKFISNSFFENPAVGGGLLNHLL